MAAVIRNLYVKELLKYKSYYANGDRKKPFDRAEKPLISLYMHIETMFVFVGGRGIYMARFLSSARSRLFIVVFFCEKRKTMNS